MATYQFSTITTTQAQSYRAATDDLQFGGLGAATAANFEVIFGSLSGNMTIRYLPTGGSVTLGSDAVGDTLTMPDGSKLILPFQGSRNLEGGVGGDRIYGGPERDTLSGSAGDDRLETGGLRDMLTGGPGRDTLSGGPDIDTFVFAPGDSGVDETQSDVIVDWFGDILDFAAVMPGGYAELAATSRADALAAANQQISDGIDVVAVAVGGDVIVFADTGNDNGAADSSVRLAGATLTTVDAGSIRAQSPPPAPPPTTPPPTTPPPTPPAPTTPPVAPPSTGATMPEPPVPPTSGAGGAASFSFSGNMDTVSFAGMLQGDILENSSDVFQLGGASSSILMFGSGFTYQEDDEFVYGITGGEATQVSFGLPNAGCSFTLFPGISAVTLFGWVLRNQPAQAFETVLNGDDRISGFSGPFPDCSGDTPAMT